MECLSKHTLEATALRGSYKFKSAEVATIMVAAGFAVGVAGRAFLWEYLYVQGRQLATSELIQSEWPETWTQFCDSVFPGLLSFKATVDSWGTFDLNDHQLDCRDQAYADWHLCACLLTDSTFHYWDHRDSRIWQELDIFSDPTTPFMVWHHDTFAPYVRQLQHDADRAYRSMCDQRGGRKVLDQARDNLRIEVASTFDHSRAILAEMIRLLDEGKGCYQGLPQQPAPSPLAPAVHVPTISLPPDIASAKELGPLLHLWEHKMRQYFSPLLQHKPAPPVWADGSNKSGKAFAARKDMLFELDTQVAHAHANITKVKDRSKAVQHVLNAWRIKMDKYSFTDKDGTTRCITLLPTQVALCFKQAVGQKKDDVQLKVGKGAGEQKQGEVWGQTKEFLSVFKSSL